MAQKHVCIGSVASIFDKAILNPYSKFHVVCFEILMSVMMITRGALQNASSTKQRMNKSLQCDKNKVCGFKR